MINASTIALAILVLAIVFAIKALKIVPQQHAWVVERLGRFDRSLTPGLNVIIPFLDRVAYRHLLKEIPLDVPVTVAWAARDLVLPPWQAEAARRLLPFAEHITMRGVGHVPMTDNPAHVASVLLRGSGPAAAIAPIEAARPAPRRASSASGACCTGTRTTSRSTRSPRW